MPLIHKALKKITGFRVIKSGSRRSTTLAVVLTFCLMAAGLLKAAPSESQVKAGYLYNFTKYVDWPASSGSFVIGVYGDSGISSTLAALVIGKSVSGHPISVRDISSPSDVAGCSMVFVSSSEPAGPIISGAAGSPILTVGESDDFLDKGGMIEFVIDGGKVRYEINNRLARRASISISSAMLTLAENVR